MNTIPDAIWARVTQPEPSQLREVPLPAYGQSDNPSGLISVKAGIYDPTHPTAGGRAREAWTTLAFRVPASSEGSGAAADRSSIALQRSALGILSYSLWCPPHMVTAVTAAKMAAMRWNETGPYGTVPRWTRGRIQHSGTVQDCLGRSAATSKTAGRRCDSCPTCPSELLK